MRIAAIQQQIPYLFNWTEYINLVLRAIKLNLTNLVWQVVYLIPIILVCTIPIIGWFTPIFTILMEGYFLGYAMLDYGLATENKNRVAAASYVSNHKGLPIANGLLFYILHYLNLFF